MEPSAQGSSDPFLVADVDPWVGKQSEERPSSRWEWGCTRTHDRAEETPPYDSDAGSRPDRHRAHSRRSSSRGPGYSPGLLDEASGQLLWAGEAIDLNPDIMSNRRSQPGSQKEAGDWE